jgi:hypothetical protein
MCLVAARTLDLTKILITIFVSFKSYLQVYIYAYHSSFTLEGIAERSQILLRDVFSPTFYQNNSFEKWPSPLVLIQNNLNNNKHFFQLSEVCNYVALIHKQTKIISVNSINHTSQVENHQSQSSIIYCQ